MLPTSPFNARRVIDSIVAIESQENLAPNWPIREWVEFCGHMKMLGVLGCMAHMLAAKASAPVARMLQEWDVRRRKQAVHRSDLLAHFACEAKRNDLHFVVLKGMGLSAAVYGDPYARQSGDVDVLVAADDIPKADYVARKCGWMQPGEARLARPLHDSGELDAEALERLQAPYALRSNVILPHFTNYYFALPGGGAESLEVHDRFHGMDAETAANLLWSAREVVIGGEPMLTCSDEAALAVTLLSLHEDAETARANTSARSTMGFKACYDAHRQLGMLARDGRLVEASDTIERLGVRDMAETALGDVLEAFPCDEPLLEGALSGRPSVWGMPYLERLGSPGERAESGTLTVARLVRSFGTHGAEPGSPARWRGLRSAAGALNTGVSFRVAGGNAGVTVEWSLPHWAAPELERLVFQAVAIADDDDGDVGWRINAFVDSGEWRATVSPIAPGAVDGHANRISRGDAAPCEYREAGRVVSARVWELSSPSGCRVYGSVWERVYGQLHRRIAGDDFADVVEGAIAAGGLLARPYAEFLPELRGATLFKDMTDLEILAALDAMSPPVCDGPLRPPADGAPHGAFRMVLRTDPPKQASPRRFAYDGQRRGEPGMLMGEVLVLSRKELYMRPTPLSAKPPLPPLEGSMLTLEFTPEMLEAPCSGDAARAMSKVRRNMMGLLAQKVVDVRRELYLERSGYDMYAPENLFERGKA